LLLLLTGKADASLWLSMTSIGFVGYAFLFSAGARQGMNHFVIIA
jgi:hypothetical protein